MERAIVLPEATNSHIYPNLIEPGPNKMIIVYLDNNMVGFIEYIDCDWSLIIGTEWKDSDSSLETLIRDNPQYTYRLIES
jgi:hypothetical protein